MKLIRGMLTDLRERQILPAVVLLVLLAFAVPIGASIILGKVTTPPTPPLAPDNVKIPAGLPSPANELAVLNGKPPSSDTRHGSPSDPFGGASSSSGGSGGSGGSSTPTPPTPPPVVHTTTTVTVTHTAVATTTQTHTQTATRTTTATHTKTVPSKGTTTTTTSTHTTGSGAPLTGPASLSADQAYTVTLDTRDAQGTHELSNVVRLAPLPAAQSPEVVFLGVLKGGAKAVFLFANPVKFTGSKSETCLPEPADCQIIELGPGQGMKLAPASNTALIATFTFEVGSIGAKSYSSASAALNARGATSSSGQTLLPLIGSTELTDFHFDPAIGALTFKAGSSGSGATGSNGTNAIVGSDGSTGAQVGSSAGVLQGRRSFVLAPAR
jgi:hypothetical protein